MNLAAGMRLGTEFGAYDPVEPGHLAPFVLKIAAQNPPDQDETGKGIGFLQAICGRCAGRCNPDHGSPYGNSTS